MRGETAMPMPARFPVYLMWGASLLMGCAASLDVPPPLLSQLDRQTTFEQIKASPDSYRGRMVLLGGEVLGAKRLKEGTRIEILQLPLDGAGEPARDRLASEGRFLAVQKEFLDPATLPPGTRLMLVGELTGSTTLPLDDVDYAYPTLEIKYFKVWPQPASATPTMRPPPVPYGTRPFPTPYPGYYR